MNSHSTFPQKAAATPPVAALPGAIPTPGAGDHLQWHETPEARALLAGIAASPPRLRSFRTDFAITSDEWTAYTGPRVRELEALHEPVAMAALDAHGAGIITRDECAAILAQDAQWAIRETLGAVQ